MNKVCLLKRIGKRRSHRSIIMQSHSNMVPENADLVAKEPLLEVSNYLKLLKATFANCYHFQVSWDPSTYSGDNVMVLTVWSNECQKAAYLPLQYLMPVEKKEVDAEFQALAQRKEITRVEGYAELRAVSHALAAIGKELSIFEIPNTVMYKPLKSQEVRLFAEGEFWIRNIITGEECKQIPDHWSFKTQHCLVSLSDQGGVNRGALDFCQYMVPIALLIGYDGQHRCYNDLKSSLRQSGLYRTYLACAVVFNLGYGPAGSKTWFARKQRALKEFVSNNNCHRLPFIDFVGRICQERQEVEDGSAHQREKMWDAL